MLGAVRVCVLGAVRVRVLGAVRNAVLGAVGVARRGGINRVQIIWCWDSRHPWLGPLQVVLRVLCEGASTKGCKQQLVVRASPLDPVRLHGVLVVESMLGRCILLIVWVAVFCHDVSTARLSGRLAS